MTEKWSEAQCGYGCGVQCAVRWFTKQETYGKESNPTNKQTNKQKDGWSTEGRDGGAGLAWPNPSSPVMMVECEDGWEQQSGISSASYCNLPEARLAIRFDPCSPPPKKKKRVFLFFVLFLNVTKPT